MLRELLEDRAIHFQNAGMRQDEYLFAAHDYPVATSTNCVPKSPGATRRLTASSTWPTGPRNREPGKPPSETQVETRSPARSINPRAVVQSKKTTCVLSIRPL